MPAPCALHAPASAPPLASRVRASLPPLPPSPPPTPSPTPNPQPPTPPPNPHPPRSDISTEAAASNTYDGVGAGIEGDALAKWRLSSGGYRRFLGEKTRIPHNPDLLSQFATDTAHGHVQNAAGG
jgi:hypothetical protein